MAAVAQEGLSRRQAAAARFGASDSTAINWLKRVATTGSVAPGQIGGRKPRKIPCGIATGSSGAAGGGVFEDRSDTGVHDGYASTRESGVAVGPQQARFEKAAHLFDNLANRTATVPTAADRPCLGDGGVAGQ